MQTCKLLDEIISTPKGGQGTWAKAVEV